MWVAEKIKKYGIPKVLEAKDFRKGEKAYKLEGSSGCAKGL